MVTLAIRAAAILSGVPRTSVVFVDAPLSAPPPSEPEPLASATMMVGIGIGIGIGSVDGSVGGGLKGRSSLSIAEVTRKI